MSQQTFQRASKRAVPMKLGIMGPSGSGKTYSAILLAHGLAGNDPDKILVIDTENESAALYSDLAGGFLHHTLRPPFTPRSYISIIRQAVDSGIKVVIIDSITHAWEYILGFKEELDRKGGNSYANWGKAKPLFRELKEAILQSPVHVIACMRAKSDYAIEETEQNGNRRSSVKKLGTAAITEPGFEYEFSVVWNLDRDTNLASVEKDRTSQFQGKVETLSSNTGVRILEWLGVAASDELVAGEGWNRLASGESDEFKQSQDLAENRASKNGGFAKLTDDQKASIYTYLETLGISGEAALSELKSACLTAGKPMLHFALECQHAGIATAEDLFAKLSPPAVLQSSGTSNGALPDSTETVSASPGSSSAVEALPTITAADFNLSPGEIAKTRTLAKSLGKSPQELYSLSHLGGARDFSGIESWVSAQLKAVSK